MARPSSGAGLSIAQLQRALGERNRELEKLMHQRSQLQKKLSKVDQKIEQIDGGMSIRASSNGGGARIRPKNERSLIDTMETILQNAGKPMPVAEIVDGVKRSGYKSSAANFRALVNQTLIKDDKFGQVSRGVYQLGSGKKGK